MLASRRRATGDPPSCVMPGNADEPTPSEWMTATSTGGRRFRRRAAQAADPTMPSETQFNDLSTGLAVVPAYNERATVAGVVDALHRKAPQLDVLVVDDGSTDATAELAEEAGADVLRMPFNVGIGGAVQAGFKYAAENGYDYMVQVDGDGQHDPGEIAKLFAAARGPNRADMICGSRFATATGYIAPISRRTGIHLFAFLLSRLLRQPVTDPTSGFRLYNHRAIALFARDYPHDYPEVEAVLMLHHHRLTMREVPVRMFQRGGGVSSIGGSGKSFYYMVKVLLALFVGLGRRRAVPEPGEPAAVAADHGI
jgi:glycosyltransferase involved in cell wall biosynthesis